VEELHQRLQRQEVEHRRLWEELEQQQRQETVTADRAAYEEALTAEAEAEDDEALDWSDDGPEAEVLRVAQESGGRCPCPRG
jgi:hypothetical protein